jgi:hypothetical protein
MAGLVGRKAPGQILPARAAAQYPKDAVEHLTGIPPGSAASIGAEWWRGNQRLNDGPWLVGQFFSSGHAVNRSTTSQYL